MFKRKLLIIPGTLFLLGFMPYSGTMEENAQIPFSGPILELHGIDEMGLEEKMDKRFYHQNNLLELPDSDPRSRIPPELLDKLNSMTEIEEI